MKMEDEKFEQMGLSEAREYFEKAIADHLERESRRSLLSKCVGKIAAYLRGVRFKFIRFFNYLYLSYYLKRGHDKIKERYEEL